METKYSANLFNPFFLSISLGDRKIILPYMDDGGNIRGEVVLASLDEGFYRIKTIPLYASKLALFDLIDVREHDGHLYFHKIIVSSGRSVIQMTVFDTSGIISIEKQLKNFGCLWRTGNDQSLIAFDVPQNIPYAPIKAWLDDGEDQALWGYRVACLSH